MVEIVSEIKIKCLRTDRDTVKMLDESIIANSSADISVNRLSNRNNEPSLAISYCDFDLRSVKNRFHSDRLMTSHFIIIPIESQAIKVHVYEQSQDL
jgi:hypothetical protein